MSEANIGEIRLFGFTRIPNGWFACDGSLKSIAEYQPLFVLIGTTYGGDGIQTFGVPDLRGRLPVHQGTGTTGTNYPLGLSAGTETVTLTVAQIPSHTHVAFASTSNATTATPGPSVVPAAQTADLLYATNPGALTPLPMATTATGPNPGGPLPHDNLMPTLTGSFCICWSGVFPPHS
ncbi:tail fiber protein [Luteibacter anthropi]|uniref:phage tail protein n=1 Tax=Luteibacter anthropi TaxID=564369 RepID=UPI00203294B5|nr:tail fiber protein [Luteibacter anthropi]URX62914.1 tail fiber protein [Luteibacter anthropi]